MDGCSAMAIRNKLQYCSRNLRPLTPDSADFVGVQFQLPSRGMRMYGDTPPEFSPACVEHFA